MKTWFRVAMTAVVATFVTQAGAAAISYPDFSSVAGLTLNGDAAPFYFLGGEDAAENDSFTNGLLEHAHYTRPRIFEGREVPPVLLSGHHQEIEKWRLESSLMRTLLKRPDLLEKKELTQQEIDILKKWRRELDQLLKFRSRE